jgi:O-antigen/teichoic acid export membrane protein
MATDRRDGAARNLMTGTAAKYVLLAVNIVLGALMMPFNVRHLGKADYGLWMLVASMTYYFQLLDLGYGNGLVRHVTGADARGDVDGMNAILSTFVVVYSVLGAIALTGVVLLAVYAVPGFPHLSPMQVTTGRWVLVALGLRLAVGFPMTVFGAVTNARQRFALNTWVAVAAALVNAFVTYVVLETGHGLLTLVPATVTVSLLSYIAYAAVARHVFPQMRLSVSRFSRARLREVTAFSLYLFVISISAQIGFNLDNLIIGAFIGTAAVAVYSVASRLADYQRQLCSQFNSMLFPVVVDFEARGDASALRSTLMDGTRLAVGLVAGVTLALAAFARPLVLRWMGPGFAESIPALYALAVAGIVLVGQGPLGNILLVVGRHRLVAFGSLAESLLNLALSIVLVRRFGITGSALGTMIAVVGFNLLILVPVACRALHVGVFEFGRLAAAPAAIGAVPAGIAAWLLRAYAAPTSLGAILLCGCAVGLAYVVSFAALGLNAVDRTRYLKYLRRLRRGGGPPLAAAA